MSMNKDFDSKKIQGLTKELLIQGKTKQEIYEELVNEYKYRNKIADIIRYTPTVERLKKYSIWNTVYLVFISLITLLSFMQPSVGIIWLVVLIVLVALKRFKYYYWNTILGAVTVISVLALTLYQGMNNGFDSTLILIFSSIPLAMIFIIAGHYLPKKMTPEHTERKEKYIDKSGNDRLRIIHLFEE